MSWSGHKGMRGPPGPGVECKRLSFKPDDFVTINLDEYAPHGADAGEMRTYIGILHGRVPRASFWILFGTVLVLNQFEKELPCSTH